MIIFLNGCSSAGKSTLARALQHLSKEPLIHVGVDTFINMMPKRYMPGGTLQHEGFYLETTPNTIEPELTIKTGSFGQIFFGARAQVIQTLADMNISIIIDEVIEHRCDLENYVLALQKHTVYFIGIYCNPDIVAEREILRGDRAWGLARGQIKNIHTMEDHYDMKLDTTCTSYFNLAHDILKFIEKNPQPQGFKTYQAASC